MFELLVHEIVAITMETDQLEEPRLKILAFDEVETLQFEVIGGIAQFLTIDTKHFLLLDDLLSEEYS